MKKLILFIIILFFALFPAYSQDLIVTNTSDSINCIITSLESDYIYFTFNCNGEIRSTLLPVSQMIYSQKEFYNMSKVPKEKIVGYKAPYQKFRLAIHGGYSYYFKQKYKDNLQDNNSKLKSAYHFGADLTYYYKMVGFGCKYTMTKFASSERLQTWGTYKVIDDITNTYIGPAISFRLMNHDQSNALLFNISIGRMNHSNNKKWKDISYEITGNTVGMIIDFGYDLGITKNLSLGFQASFITAVLNSYEEKEIGTITDLKIHQEYIFSNLNRLDFSLGIRFKI